MNSTLRMPIGLESPVFPNEAPADRLKRLEKSLAYYEGKSGRHAGVQASRLRREVRRCRAYIEQEETMSG